MLVVLSVGGEENGEMVVRKKEILIQLTDRVVNLIGRDVVGVS